MINPNQATLDLLKASLGAPSDELAKTVSTTTGLVAYDLQAPAKNLYPVNTPIRNKLPRVHGGTGVATNWKQLSNIVGSGFDSSGWVPEGQRSARMSYVTASKSASYVTLGEEDQITFEAINAAVGFEDVQATATMRMLQKMMLKEEQALLFGNAGLTLAVPAAPTLTATGSGATLPALTYSVICVALTGEGWKNSSLVGGVALSKTITGADGQSFTLNGGASNKSAGTSQAITLGQTLGATTPPVLGAVAYAWFVGAVGAETLQAITTSSTAVFSAPLLGSQQAATAVTGDFSANPSYAFNGLFTATALGGSGSYVKQLAAGVAGVGTTLTPSTRGTIVEIDVMLQNLWDNYQVSPTVLYVNSQELKNITNKILNSGSGPLVTSYKDPANPYQLTAGGTVRFYFNPFMMGGGDSIPILIHPNLPAGTILAWCENLPAQYQSNNVPNVAEVKVRADYYQLDFALRTRAREFGVYAEETLAIYAPFAMGVISNIANG
jgi:hypothetical protein